MSLTPGQETARSTVPCQNCGTEASVGAKFCATCGAGLTRACPTCGSPFKPGLKFCEGCGAPLGVSPAAPPVPLAAVAPVCLRCGLPLKPGIKFCGSCGQPVGEAVQRAASAPQQPQRAEIPAPRARAPAAKPTPAPRRSGSRLGGALRGCATALIIILVAVVALYFVFRSGIITQDALLNLAGLGPATVEVMNFRDDEIQASITPLHESKGEIEEDAPSVFALESFDFASYRAESPGKYRIDLQSQVSRTGLGICTLTVRGGDKYLFIVLRNGVMIDRLSAPSKTPTDLDVETSALCGQ